MDLTPVLTELVLLAEDPCADAQEICRKFVVCLPLIKNPMNIYMLVDRVGRARQIVATVSATAYLVDGVSAACARKEQISNPTILYDEWIEHIIRGVQTLPALSALAIAAGLASRLTSSSSSRFLTSTNERIILEAVRQIVGQNVGTNSSRDLTTRAGVVACLAKAQRFLSDSAKQQLPYDALFDFACKFLFAAQWLDPLLEGHLFEQYAIYSRFMALCLEHVTINSLHLYLEVARIFTTSAIAMYPGDSSLAKYKTYLFGLVLQTQGIALQLLRRGRQMNRKAQRPQIATLLLQLFQPLGYIIEAVGGHFDVLDFVSSVAIDSILEYSGNRQSANQTLVLLMRGTENLQLDSPFNRGMLLYTLEMVEALLPGLSMDAVHSVCLPLVEKLLNSSIEPSPLTDAAHMFMLTYLDVFELKNRITERPNEIIIWYVDSLLRSFPGRLTFGKFMTAISNITSIMTLPCSIRAAVLEKLFMASKACIPGVRPNNWQASDPPSLRAALIAALFLAMTRLCEVNEFAGWLHKLTSMMPTNYGPAVASERKWIHDYVSDTLNELSLPLSDVGIKWWFTNFSRL